MARAFIAVAGNIGSGKSSLTEFLCNYFELEPLFEPNEENPYLADFYKDMRKWAFHSQLWFLARKLKMATQIVASDAAVVQDRTVYEDAEVFCTNLYRMRLMRKAEYQLYWDIYSSACPLLPKPDLLIYLKCPIRVLRKRIKLRGRKMEQNLSPRYLRRLQQLYDAWIERYDLSPVIELDTSELDFVHDLIDRSEVIERIREILAERGVGLKR